MRVTNSVDTPRPQGPDQAKRSRPGPRGHQKTVLTTCAMWDRHSSRRMATSARGHGERIIALCQQRAGIGIGVQGGIGRWLCHTRVRADASRRHPFFGSDRCVAPGGHPVRGTVSVKIRTIPGPAILSKPRRALFALVSDALPLYHQQTKNLLVAPKSTAYGHGMHSEELAECAPQFRRPRSRIRTNVDGTAPSITPTRSPVLIGSAKSSSTHDG